MNFTITPFDTKNLEHLNRIAPTEWHGNAYDLVSQNENKPWFHSYQLLSDETLIGFGMFFKFEDHAWLGWIIVNEKYRNRGLGKQITEHLMLQASSLGVKNFTLTATELGLPIYEKIGFQIVTNYIFLKPPATFQPEYEASNITKASIDDLKHIAKIDYEATGEYRENFIQNYLNETFVCRTNSGIAGFCIPNLVNGFIAAKNLITAKNLLQFHFSKKNGSIIIPQNNKAGIKYLQGLGFEKTGSTPRMSYGDMPAWNEKMIFSRAAGYCG
jgi:GNAT superfamily N-acetyltransferase